MNETAYLRARAAALRSAAETARDPLVVRALREVAAEFEYEARIAAADAATHHPGPRRWASAA